MQTSYENGRWRKPLGEADVAWLVTQFALHKAKIEAMWGPGQGVQSAQRRVRDAEVHR